MRGIKVKTAELVSKLKANRETHGQDYVAAYGGYRDKVIEALEDRIAEIKARIETVRGAKPGDRIDHYIGPVDLSTPEDHTIDYDRAIDQLTWEQEPEVVVSEDDFNKFVRDEWDWRGRFQTITTAYTDAG